MIPAHFKICFTSFIALKGFEALVSVYGDSQALHLHQPGGAADGGEDIDGGEGGAGALKDLADDGIIGRIPQIDKAVGYHPIHHILNSAGIERLTQYQKDMVRLGIGIYGVSAVDQSLVKPVASLKCRILQIKELSPADGTVGYGRHGKIEKPSKIATLPLGYADGINRHMGRGAAKFCVNGKLVPTIGNICMDMCMIDVTGVKDVKVGDIVTVFGDKPTAIDQAKVLGTIPYEIYTSIAKRVKRVVVK